MTEKETKCFIEELPNDTILHGKYTTQLKEKDSDVYQKTAPGMGMHVEVKDPEKKVYNPEIISSQLTPYLGCLGT